MNFESNKDVISADSIGELALQRIRLSRHWRIIGVYRSCFYCKDDSGEILCIGSERIERGPFTINSPSIGGLLETGISAGAVLNSDDSCLHFRDFSCCIDMGGAEIWDAAFPVYPEPLTSLESDVGVLISLARRYAPLESLGQLIPRTFTEDSRSSTGIPFLSELLHERVWESIKCICQDIEDKSQEDSTAVLVNHLTSLIGAGYGLTPSGDDFCCGVILGIARTQNHRAAESLAMALNTVAEGRTTTLSLAFFRSLAEARVSETQDRLLSHFGNSGVTDIRPILLRAASHGSTSGWDMLAGWAFGVELFRRRSLAGNAAYEKGCVC